MLLSAQYKRWMTELLDAASTLFFKGATPSALGLKISKKVNIEGTGLDGQVHTDTTTMKCYVQISETATFMGDAQPMLTKFAIAHELGHACAAEIGDAIGTSGLPMGSQKHEIAADLIGTCLLLKTDVTPIMITSALNSYGDFIMDKDATGTHPSQKARMGFISALFTKVRSQKKPEIEAIREVLASS